ncbi:hypothetical protein CSC02_0347 [Enterobacter hormaechei subsp. hoffmannii]|nr:hypothetical protein CSC02_0347 [Enterobacter hormaechei subsp. hoffmannii]
MGRLPYKTQYHYPLKIKNPHRCGLIFYQYSLTARTIVFIAIVRRTDI